MCNVFTVLCCIVSYPYFLYQSQWKQNFYVLSWTNKDYSESESESELPWNLKIKYPFNWEKHNILTDSIVTHFGSTFCRHFRKLPSSFPEHRQIQRLNTVTYNLFATYTQLHYKNSQLKTEKEKKNRMRGCLVLIWGPVMWFGRAIRDECDGHGVWVGNDLLWECKWLYWAGNQSLMGVWVELRDGRSVRAYSHYWKIRCHMIRCHMKRRYRCMKLNQLQHSHHFVWQPFPFCWVRRLNLRSYM